MDLSYTITMSLFWTTILIGLICKMGRDGSLGRFVGNYGDKILVTLYSVIGLALTAGVWWTICFAVCLNYLHVPSERIFILMRDGSTFQRVAGFCLARSVPVLFLSLFAFALTSYELEDDEDAPQLLALLIGDSLLGALARPFAFVDLFAGSVEAANDGVVVGESVNRGEVMRSLIGISFLVFMACGTLALAG